MDPSPQNKPSKLIGADTWRIVGGEAALVAAGGAPFGIGSDLAGSLRIPAAMRGIVSLKPTEGRLVVTNSHGGVPGRGRLGLSYGFFTRNVEDQVFLLDNILSSENYVKVVRKTAPVPFRHSAFKAEKKLKIGYFVNDGFLKPVPACARAVNDTVEKLKGAGHELVVFKVPEPMHMAEMFFKNLMPDGGDYMKGLFAHDLVDKYMTSFVALLKVCMSSYLPTKCFQIPLLVRYVASYLALPISPQFALLCRSYVTNLPDLRKNQELTDDYFEKIDSWRKCDNSHNCGRMPNSMPSFAPRLQYLRFRTNTRAILAPVPCPRAFSTCSTTSAGVVPTGVVSDDDDDEPVDKDEDEVIDAPEEDEPKESEEDEVTTEAPEDDDDKDDQDGKDDNVVKSEQEDDAINEPANDGNGTDNKTERLKVDRMRTTSRSMKMLSKC
ncbi:hypothetical protein L596_005545 [Steinernema carpocapsae]|uniref:Amidase domain-containing protein n=1 Tax=Steinernema carpocapsae TaxID=34508 RepID=A0A4V6I8I9_STECR|nr:hypothetical protein L596_005545 [Steinernema carpocapsae]